MITLTLMLGAAAVAVCHLSVFLDPVGLAVVNVAVAQVAEAVVEVVLIALVWKELRKLQLRGSWCPINAVNVTTKIPNSRTLTEDIKLAVT